MGKGNLFEDARTIIDAGRSCAYRDLNAVVNQGYYELGRRIAEEEQSGSTETGCDKDLLARLSRNLTKDFGRGFSAARLEQIRDAYKASPYERLALSSDKQQVMSLASAGQVVEKPSDLVKDPYVLEFVGLDERPAYSEGDLEAAIISNLEKFLLEMGRGFTFVGRQVRFTFEEDHYFVDLVLFNRLLRCFVLVDLKIGKLKHQDLGQMQMYVNYYDRYERLEGENPTIGIVLCKDKSDSMVELTLPKDNEQIFASRYQTVLPSKAELRKLLDDSVAEFAGEEDMR